MRKVISNTTPIIALAKIDKLHILKDLYGEIIIPEAVNFEIADPISRKQVDDADWIFVKSIKNTSLKKAYSPRLHNGEIEVIILAKEENADLVLIDDNTAKKTAKFMDLNVTGTLGVLVKAKREGVMDTIKPAINDLINTGFYVASEIVEMVLEEVGEI